MTIKPILCLMLTLQKFLHHTFLCTLSDSPWLLVGPCCKGFISCYSSRSVFCWEHGSVVLCCVDTHKGVGFVSFLEDAVYIGSPDCMIPLAPLLPFLLHISGRKCNITRHRLQPAMHKLFKSLPLIIHFLRFSCLVTHILSEVVCSYDWHLIFIPRSTILLAA